MPRGDAHQGYRNLQRGRKKDFPMVHVTVMLRPDQVVAIQELHHKDSITVSDAHRLIMDWGIEFMKAAGSVS